MSDMQFYIALGLPMLLNATGFTAVFIMAGMLSGRMTRLEDKMDLLTTKVVDIDNRVVRIEDKLGISPR